MRDAPVSDSGLGLNGGEQNAPSGAPPAPAAAPEPAAPRAQPTANTETLARENTQPADPTPPSPPWDDLFDDDDDDEDVAAPAKPGELFDDEDDDGALADADEAEDEEEFEDPGDEEEEEEEDADDDEALARKMQDEWKEEDTRPRRRNRRALRRDSSESPPRKRPALKKERAPSRRAAAQKSYAEVGSSAEDESDADNSDGSPRTKGDTYGTKRRSPPQTEEARTGIERLLCQETLSKNEWRPILEKMRTKHVVHGSALDVPDGGEALPEDEALPITRYLVKWKQFSFLHVSWETKRDLEAVDGPACKRALLSLMGRQRKGQVPELGTPPCAKRAFDPQMIDVERVLELPGLLGGEAGDRRKALNLPPPDLEEDGVFENDDTFAAFIMKPEFSEPHQGFATAESTPGPTHALPQLISPSFSPPGHNALNTAPARLVFDKNAKKAFLQTVKAVTEKRDTVTYDLLLKQYQCLAHHVLQFRNIKPSDTIQVERPGGKEKLHFNTVTFSAYLLKICQTNLKESKRNAKKDNQDTM